MPITSRVDEEKQLTIFTGTGELSFDEVRDAITSFYEGGHSLKVLWDLRAAMAREISSGQVEQIARLLDEHRGRSKGVKTAIVTPTDLNFGLSRMLISFMEIREERYPAFMKVFRNMDEAVSWLL
jgi:hypothetical protein